ncbi:Hypothetical predicted protein [Marmota monax]|uniref:Uncharacterized protein n=1 Tax=Marmota monax TaxID=9995 RepID=A0A5E4A174_MARMO|nr:hypothetical protein GHT09_001014 [Marmota monax]VTJ50940.1 Hypothetical predicted protein [Marmota monax]
MDHQRRLLVSSRGGRREQGLHFQSTEEPLPHRRSKGQLGWQEALHLSYHLASLWLHRREARASDTLMLATPLVHLPQGSKVTIISPDLGQAMESELLGFTLMPLAAWPGPPSPSPCLTTLQPHAGLCALRQPHLHT